MSSTDIVNSIRLIVATFGALVSQFTEHWPWYADLSPIKKVLVQAGLLLVLAVLSLVFTNFTTGSQMDGILAILTILLNFVLGTVGNVLYHQGVNVPMRRRKEWRLAMKEAPRALSSDPVVASGQG